MGPAEFSGKEEEWLRWKEKTEDYVDAVHPGMKQALSLAAQVKSQVTDRLQVNLTEEEWNLRCNLFMLLKRVIGRGTKLGDVCGSSERIRGMATPDWEVRTTSWYPQDERNCRTHGVTEQTL